MARIPNIIVHDFCVWLNEQIKEKIMGDSVHLLNEPLYDSLVPYAEIYLKQRRNSERILCFPVRSVIESFLSNEECNALQAKLRTEYSYWDYYWQHEPFSVRKVYSEEMIHQHLVSSFRFAIEEALHHYLLRCFDQALESGKMSYNFSSYDLARAAVDYLQAYDRKSNENTVITLFSRLYSEVADEIAFLEWFIRRRENIFVHTNTSLINLPSVVFNDLVTQFAEETGKQTEVCERLRDDYYHAGWRLIIYRIMEWHEMNGTPNSNTIERIRRYDLISDSRYSCIILPSTQTQSSKQISEIAKELWENLHDLEGRELTIYYCETEKGKTGYDIAKLFEDMQKFIGDTAPSIIVWKYHISEAKPISIEGLNHGQLRDTVKALIQAIQTKNDLDDIIQEVAKTVEIQRKQNRSKNAK